MSDHRISRRELLRWSTLAGMGTLLAACAPKLAKAPTGAPTSKPAEQPQATDVPAATAPAPQEEQTIVFWTWAESNFPHYLKQAERWNETMTGKPKIKFDGLIVPDVMEKGMNAMAAGSGMPDVYLLEISSFTLFLKDDPPLCEQYLLDYTPRLDVFNSNWKEDYLGFAPYTWQGKVYGIEIGLCPTAYYYRKDLFDEVGIQMPLETWEDWMVAGEKMKAAGHAMTAFDNSPEYFVQDLYQAGGSLFDANAEIAIENSTAYRVLDLSCSGAREGIRWTTEGYWDTPHYAALNDGTVAGVLSAIWYSLHALKPNVTEENKGKWRVQPMPAWSKSAPWGGPDFDTRQTSTWGGTALTIPKGSTHPDLTFDFLAFAHLTKEGAASVYQNMEQMPVVKAVIHDDSVTNIPDEFYGGQAAIKVFADIADQIPPKFPHPFWNEAQTELGNIIIPAVEGEGTYEDLLAQAAVRIRDLIAAG